MALKKRPLLLGALVLVLAMVPMLLILETNGESEEATNSEVAAPVEVESLVAPSDLPAIVYAANIDGEFRIFATDPEGKEKVEVLDEVGTDPVWTPDGSEVYFVAEADGMTQKRLGLYRVAEDRKVELVKKGPQIPSQISFRQGTDEITVQSTLQSVGATAGIKYYSSIDAVNTRTGAQKTLFDANGSAYAPAWSPDGETLLVVAGQAGCRSEGICPQRIEELAPDGSSKGTLIGSGAAGSPAWSPDGSRIAFTWDRGRGPGVWVTDSAGRDPVRVTDGKPPVSDPDFSPDSRSVVFSRSCELFVQPVSGGPAVNITKTPEICEITPDWRGAEK